jgi:hypothetical protein
MFRYAEKFSKYEGNHFGNKVSIYGNFDGDWNVNDMLLLEAEKRNPEAMIIGGLSKDYLSYL